MKLPLWLRCSNMASHAHAHVGILSAVHLADPAYFRFHAPFADAVCQECRVFSLAQDTLDRATIEATGVPCNVYYASEAIELVDESVNETVSESKVPDESL